VQAVPVAVAEITPQALPFPVVPVHLVRAMRVVQEAVLTVLITLVAAAVVPEQQVEMQSMAVRVLLLLLVVQV
jgi:hypothetical protein